MENDRFENLFEKYDPPSGGVQGLREKLENSPKKVHFISIPKIAIASAFIAVIFISVILTHDLLKPKRNLFVDLVHASNNPVFIKYGYKKPAGESVSIPDSAKSNLAALRIETSNKNVKFYLIESKI